MKKVTDSVCICFETHVSVKDTFVTLPTDRIDGSKHEDNSQQQDQEVVTSTASASTSAWPTTEEMDYMSPTEVADRRALKTGGRVAGHFRAPDDDEDDEVDLHK